jgi:hypothetical protein
MHYHRPLLLALAALLLVPAAASAKEITRAEVCGAVDCAVLTDHGELRGFVDLGPPTAAPKAHAPHFEVRLTTTAGGRSETSVFVYVPSARRLGTGVTGSYDWFDTRTPAGALLARAAAGLEPFPAARLRAVPAARAARRDARASGFPWAIPAVLVGMLGVFGLGMAGQRRLG